MKIMENKKARGPNFTGDEKALLISIIAKYKDIIECKRTNATTWREKEESWKKITMEFNKTNIANIYRNLESLKKYYLNIKKDHRKNVADSRVNLLKTGGGTFKTKDENNLLDLILPEKSVKGLTNPYDGDSSYDYNSPDLFTDGQDLLDDPDKYEVEYLDENILTEIINNNIPTENSENKENEIDYVETSLEATMTKNWSRYKISDLQAPVNPRLKNTWTQRRRPAAFMQSSNLEKKYSDLADLKTELTKLKMRVQEEKLKILQVEKKIKEEHLKNMRL